MQEQLSRRTFLGTGAGLVTTAFGFDLRPAQAAARELKITRTTQTHSVCPYCAVGCSVVIHTLGDKAENVKPTVVHIEGDPGSPINRGTLCPKGISLKEFVVNERRLNVAMIGGCTDTNEINYLLGKFRFSLGILTYENQARL
jgi:formate dehydrogenase major subunit